MSSTIERCPACSAQVLVPADAGGSLRCDSCGMRLSRPRERRDGVAWSARADDGLGIHPALARRYRGRDPREAEGATADEGGPPSVQLSPSLVGEGAGELYESDVLKPSAGETAAVATAIESPARRGSASGRTRAIAGGGKHDTPVQRPRQKPPAREQPLPELPGFRVLEQVGKGAMGRVFRAEDLESGRVAAVKVLAPELAARPDFVARFEREAAALKRVRHRGVVRIVGSGSSGDLHFLSMDYVEGVSLRRILEQGPQPPGRALGFARQIVQGLGAAHAVGVIHRDLKPENILVEQRQGLEGQLSPERLVLVDFGLAGIIDEKEDPHPNLTKSRMTMGTVNYMAPEQRTDAKRVDQRADLYASGVILYELLTGDLPLGRFALPTERGLQLPAALDDVVVKTLARVPEERYQDAAALDHDLEAIEAELAHAASMDTLVGPGPLDAQAPADAPPAPDAGDGVPPGASRDSMLPSEAPGPEWHTAPPWVKRPELLWGMLALAVGAIAGLWVAPGEGAAIAAALVAPTPTERTDDDGVRAASLDLQGEAGRWRATAEGFRAEEGAIAYAPAAGAAGPAFLLAPAPLSGDLVEARARVALPEGGEGGWAAVLLVDAEGHGGVGVSLTGGGCARVFLAEGRVRLEPFSCALEGGSASLRLRCALSEGRCAASLGGQALEALAAPLPSPATFALGCEGTGCRFLAP